MALAKLISTRDAAAAFGISRDTFLRMVATADVKPFKISFYKNGRKKFFWKESELERLQRRKPRLLAHASRF